MCQLYPCLAISNGFSVTLVGATEGDSVTISAYSVGFYNPCLCESDLTYGVQRHAAGTLPGIIPGCLVETNGVDIEG